MNQKVIALGLLGLAIVAGLFFIFPKKNRENTNPFSNLTTKTSKIIPSPTPFPFQELTIPFLRDRKYQSKIGEMEKYTEAPTYESFLTSYDSDGLKVNGLLTIPKGTMPKEGWPAIVFVHGYIPPTLYQTTQNYVAYIDFLARNGFVVFKIDLRGHGNSEGEPGGGYYSSDYVIDTLNARAALETSDFVNKQKIGLWGHSMAGNVTLRAFAARPEIPAVVIWAGAGYTYEDLREYGITDNSYRPPVNDAKRQSKRRELFEKYGSPSAQVKFWQEVAPTSYLDDLKGAIELHHAVDDNVVSIEYSRNLNKLLGQTKVTHEFHEYPTGGHNIQDPSFGSAMQETVNFFKKYLD